MDYPWCDYCWKGVPVWHFVYGSRDCTVIRHWRVCNTCLVRLEEMCGESTLIDDCTGSHIVHDAVWEPIEGS